MYVECNAIPWERYKWSPGGPRVPARSCAEAPWKCWVSAETLKDGSLDQDAIGQLCLLVDKTWDGFSVLMCIVAGILNLLFSTQWSILDNNFLTITVEDQCYSTFSARMSPESPALILSNELSTEDRLCLVPRKNNSVAICSFCFVWCEN